MKRDCGEQKSGYYETATLRLSLYAETTYNCNRNPNKGFPLMLEPLTIVTGIPLKAFP